MEPNTSSIIDPKQRNDLRPSFTLHRDYNNESQIEETELYSSGYSSELNIDSGYNSHNNSIFTLNNTPNVSTSLSLLSSTKVSVTDTITPQKISNTRFHNNNLNPIPESPDPNKLTPVTQNIRKIFNIHITTPKSIVKRKSIPTLEFDEYQSTPKKVRTDVNLEKIVLNKNVKYTCTTPLRNRRTKNSNKRLFRQKLHSAPDLDTDFLGDNIENVSDYGYDGNKLELTPIRSSISFREKRTPLSSTSSNLMQASTPKSTNKSNNYQSSSFNKSSSVRKLLSFSDKEFEALLNTTSCLKESIPVPEKIQEEKKDEKLLSTIDIYQADSFREYQKKLPQISTQSTYVPETNAIKRPFKEILKFSYESSPIFNESEEIQKSVQTSLSLPLNENNNSRESKNDDLLLQDDSIQEYKTLYPVIDDVFRERRMLKRRSSTARLIDIKRESHFVTKLNCHQRNRITNEKAQTETNTERYKKPLEVKGFQEILGYIPSSYDLEISTKCNVDDEINKAQEKEKIDVETEKNSLKNFENTTTGKNESELKNDNVSKELSSVFVKNELLSLSNSQNNENNLVLNEICFWDDNFRSGNSTPPPTRRLSPKKHKENVLEVNFAENTEKWLPTTPKKHLQKHNSCSIDYEKNEILYPSIPRTPSKKTSLLKHKTSSSTSDIPLKRKASFVKENKKRSRIFYDGFTHLNIIGKLESYDLVLDRIFSLLSSQDLMNLTLVSKNLHNIVYENQKAKQRIFQYLNEYQKTKENDIKTINYKKSATISSSSSSIDIDRRNSILFQCQSKKMLSSSGGERVPFRNTNSSSDRKRTSVLSLQRSPPVSPSKRKFHENQKIVKLLKSNEKLIKCPRCSKSSRIINIYPSSSLSGSIENDNNDVNNMNLNTRYSIINQQSTFHSSKSTSNNFRNNDLMLFTCSQPSSSSSSSSSQTSTFVPILSNKTIKPKLIKSVSADSAIVLPTTPVKRHNVESNNNSIIKQEKYGQCTGIVCNYSFCLDCLCEYHPNVPCKTTANNSPTKEDVQNGILQINPLYMTTTTIPSNDIHSSNGGTTTSTNSRSLKTRRKSLKRLCF